MYDTSSLTERQKQALRAAYDVELVAVVVPVSKKELFGELNKRGFLGSGAAGIITSLRQKLNPFRSYGESSFELSEEAAEAAKTIEFDIEKCKPPVREFKKSTGPTFAEQMEGSYEPKVRTPKPRPEGYGDCDLDRVDDEDVEVLKGKERGYIRGWNAFKRKRSFRS